MIKGLAKNEYVISLSNKISVAVISLFTSVLLNRYLGASIKGEFASMLAYTSLAATVLDLGIYQAYPYFKKKLGTQMLSSFANLIFLQFVFYLAISFILAAFVGDPATKLAIVIVPTIIYGVQLSNIVLAEDIKYRSKANVTSNIFNLVVLAVLFFVFKKCNNVIIPLSITLTVQIVVISLLSRRIKIRIKVKGIDWNLIWKILKFGFYPMLTLLLLTLNYKIGIITLRSLGVSTARIGVFSTGVGLSAYMWIIPDGFKDVMFNKTSKGNPVEELLIVLKVTFLVGICSVIGVSLFGRQIIILLYGLEFAPAYKVTIVLFAGIISMMYFKIIGTLFLSNGKREIYFFTLLGSVTLNIIFNFLLIPHFEIMGTAVATGVSYTVMGIVFVIAFSRMYNIKVRRMFILNKQDIRTISGSFKNMLGKS